MKLLVKSLFLLGAIMLTGTMQAQETQSRKGDKSKRKMGAEISAMDAPLAVQQAIQSDKFKGQEVVKIMHAKGENREFYIVKFKDGEKTNVHRFAPDGTEKQMKKNGKGHKKQRGRKG
jgi:hypothetical protein